MEPEEPYRLTATQAVSRFADGSLTVEAYARSILARIAERDDAVRAWAYLDPEQVLAQARQLDQIPRDQRGPLHGVSVAVKDVIYTKDMPTEHNSALYKGSKPGVDAGSVQILRIAGALILGKTRTTEFAATTRGPATRNPHDPLRTPGGSSSGSGAAVGDFQAAIALGTQTGGSMIRPASFNGVYALKPTWNSITREGQKVYSLLFDTLGLYARSVADLEMLADVFALADDDDDDALDNGETNSGSGGGQGGEFVLQGARFALIKTPVWPQAGAGTIAAMDKAASLLRQHGAQVTEISLPAELDQVPEWHRVVLHSEGRVSFLPDYRCRTGEDHQLLLDDFLVGHVENRDRITRRQQLAAWDGLAALRPRVDEVARGFDAVLAPSVPDEAPLGLESTGSAAFNAMWTALHTPVINLPGFQGANGMPIGLSLVGPRYGDRRLLRVAQVVGEVFEREGGWTRRL
ncbi:amidase [Microdochium bolleyi]|uniref:Amidase n=1 Tax=Microdochium bolleyi TaxID=196109 RepID=A0A136JGB7_9PEZI|nr:amidase [Microdochium bolleyi]